MTSGNRLWIGLIWISLLGNSRAWSQEFDAETLASVEEARLDPAEIVTGSGGVIAIAGTAAGAAGYLQDVRVRKDDAKLGAIEELRREVQRLEKEHASPKGAYVQVGERIIKDERSSELKLKQNAVTKLRASLSVAENKYLGNDAYAKDYTREFSGDYLERLKKRNANHRKMLDPTLIDKLGDPTHTPLKSVIKRFNTSPFKKFGTVGALAGLATSFSGIMLDRGEKLPSEKIAEAAYEEISEGEKASH